MAHPQSNRFIPIREAICAVLASAPELAEVKSIVRDREAFARLPTTRLPALGVFFADLAGAERPRWASNRRDHAYQLEVHLSVCSLESGQTCEDLLFAYVEALEDALRAAPTLGGLVRSMSVSLVRRTRSRAESYWYSQAVLLVTCEQRTP
jgi:hypothetical protein